MESYEEIFERMISEYTKRTGINPTESSDIRIRLRVLAGEIFALKVNKKWLKDQMFVQTAIGKYLDYHGEEKGLTRKEGVKSVGTVNAKMDEPQKHFVSFPSGTIFSTGGENPQTFENYGTMSMPPGSIEVNIPVRATEPGEKGNIKAGAIKHIVTPVDGPVTINNNYNFYNGMDKESDDKFRQRILDNYKNVSNSTNITFYKNIALLNQHVYSVGVIPLKRGPGTVDVYLADKGRKTAESAIGNVGAALSREREINTDVKVHHAIEQRVNIYVAIAAGMGTSIHSIRATCKKAIEDYINSLGVGKNVYLSSVGNALHNVYGVLHYRFNTNLCFDVIIDQDSFALPGEIVITEKERV